MSVKFFQDLSKNNVNTAGGKGASLAEMYNAGINVPNGFVVLTDGTDDEGILQAFDKLNAKFVAVRSSATNEDGAESAWAGQLESYLNVGREKLLESVKKCQASTHSARADLYRAKKGEGAESAVAVVVQKMVESDVSGVAFSVNPVNGANEIVIEAAWGLGEAIVSGNVNPDNYVVNKNLKVVSKIVKVQSKKLIKNFANENAWMELGKFEASAQKLTNAQILELARKIIEIEKYYGWPVDVEWAYEKGKLYILQCRPITTLQNDKLDKLINKITKDGDWIFYVSRKFNFYTWNAYAVASGKKCQEKVLGFEVATKNNLALNGDEYYKETDATEKNEKFAKYFAADVEFFEKFATKEFAIVDRAKKYVADMREKDFTSFSDAELKNELKEFNEIYLETCVTGYTRPDDYLEEVLKSELGDEVFEKVATVPELGVLAYSEEPVDLLKIAKASLSGENVDELLEEHVQKYAWMKGPVLVEDTKFEKADYLARLEFLRNEDVDAKLAQVLKTREQNEKTYEQVLAENNFSEQTLKLIDALRKFIFLRTYTTECSDWLFYVARRSLFVEIGRRCNISVDDLIMLGADEIAEILGGGSTEKMLDLIKMRKMAFAIVWLDGEVMHYLGEDALRLQAEVSAVYKVGTEIDSGVVVRGLPANRGKVTGCARILRDYDDIKKVEKGDIIVTTMTTPDFVAAMEKAVGFVTDEGGVTCHAAIVSREFGVPCVVGTNNATSVIRDGQEIELDAYAGVVKIL